jgi:hypothetical protein
MGGPVFNQPVEGKDDGIKKYGVRGESDLNSGVFGVTDTGFGVHGTSSSTGDGVRGWSFKGHGVRAWAFGPRSIGVLGVSPFYIGVLGFSDEGVGVYGRFGRDPLPVRIEGVAVYGRVGSDTDGTGVFGDSDNGIGVRGLSTLGPGVYGSSVHGAGVEGYMYSGVGVRGISDLGKGVFGISGSGVGVRGSSSNGFGMQGFSDSGSAVYGSSSSGSGVYARSDTGYAAYLDGDVKIVGNLQKGGGSFKIDHPLDPGNKYLSHSFVESPDMKNIYDGVVELDNNGEAEIELPDWFSALNKDFRYQLTAIGAPGPNLYIAEEISEGVTNDSNSNNNDSSNNRFKIAGGTPNMKVSWHLTGIRKDPWANTNRIQVEEDKPDKERGYYLYPELYGQAAGDGISRLLFPEEEEELLINENNRLKSKKRAKT